jgi:hypothetical protein
MKRNFISSEISYKTYLKQLYFDPEKPGSYGSVNTLYRAVRKEGKYVLGKSKIKKMVIITRGVWFSSTDQLNVSQK